MGVGRRTVGNPNLEGPLSAVLKTNVAMKPHSAAFEEIYKIDVLLHRSSLEICRFQFGVLL